MNQKTLSFKECQDIKKTINARVEKYEKMLSRFPRQKNGLLVPGVVESKSYKYTKGYFEYYFRELQKINRTIYKNHKTENQKYYSKK